MRTVIESSFASVDIGRRKSVIVEFLRKWVLLSLRRAMIGIIYEHMVNLRRASRRGLETAHFE